MTSIYKLNANQRKLLATFCNMYSPPIEVIYGIVHNGIDTVTVKGDVDVINHINKVIKE